MINISSDKPCPADKHTHAGGGHTSKYESYFDISIFLFIAILYDASTEGKSNISVQFQTHIVSGEIFPSLLLEELLRIVHEVGKEDVKEVLDELVLLLVTPGTEYSNPFWKKGKFNQLCIGTRYVRYTRIP